METEDRNEGNKRKKWTEAEDLELLAAVQKYGEGNWTNMLSTTQFTCHRSAKHLRQRWKVIRRKVGNLNLATTTTTTATTTSIDGVQLSEAQRATRIALNLALGLPLKNSFIKSAEGTSSPRFSQSCIATKPSSITVNKPVKADLSSDPVRAAAGARIATKSDAASLLRVAQARNAIHIMPTVGSSIKSALPGCASEAYSNGSFNGLPTTSVSIQSTTQQNPISGTSMDVSTTAQANTEVPLKQGLRPALEKASSQSTTQHNSIPLKQDVHTGGMNSVADVAKVQVQEHRVSIAAGKERSNRNTAEGRSSPHFSQSCIATKPSSITVNKPVKADLSSDPVRAAAVAAGARIATQSHAASLLRVAQARNAIHIMPTVGSSIKSASPGCASKAYSNGSFNGLPTTSVSIQSTTQHNPISGTAMDVSTTAQANTEVPLKQGVRAALEKASSQSTTQHNSIPLKQDVHTGGMNSTADVAKVQVQEHRVSIAAGKEPSKQVKQEKAVLLNQETQESVGESERLKAEEIICQEQMFFKLVFKDIFDAKTNCVSISKDKNECAGEW